ncbi:MAG: hypothetical protein BGO13_10895 [Burkholderiales bacterium 66-5]|nr:MAG: hypothetical protein BGO13_10895 [Burkholderiales bacterium 66-5]
MQFKSEVIVHGVKESKGTIEGRDFSSTTFHCEVDLSENSAGRSIGRATRPFKIQDAGEFDKWAHLGASLPLKAVATFEMAAAAQDGTRLMLVDIKPLEVKKAA